MKRTLNSTRMAALLAATLVLACGGELTDPPPNPGDNNNNNNNADTQAPTVQSVSPTDAATDVDRATIVEVTFSEAVNASTVTSSSFTVSGAAGSVTVNGTTATFTPDASLAEATAYTVTVTTAVQDVAGNALAANFTSTFTTKANGLPTASAGPDQDVSLGETLTLEVRPSNRAAVQLYESLGYRHMGVRAGYYADDSDALVMTKRVRETT